MIATYPYHLFIYLVTKSTFFPTLSTFTVNCGIALVVQHLPSYRMLHRNLPDDSDGTAISQLDVNDGATMQPQDSSASEAESE